MKRLKPSPNSHQWPRQSVKKIQCRKRDLVVRITDWMDDKEEPAYDVEVYVGGVYDWDESTQFTLHEHKTKKRCKTLAIEYATKQIAKLL